MHPDMFSAFEDIAGDLAPNSGTKAQTVARLFGGNADAYTTFDPSTVITKHGRYNGVSGWFAIHSGPTPQHKAIPVDNGVVGLGGRDAAGNPGNQTLAAYQLCGLGQANGIGCAVVPEPGKHNWPFAASAFRAALPWLAGQLGTPDAPKIGFPDPASPPTQTAPR
jgi:S-formylglutathione hydrolase FrmB